MCGICGVFNFAGTSSEVSAGLIKRMSDEIAHRGPDDEGLYLSADRRVGLGFRRLSIIDLAGGHQPMPNEDETIWIVFNGEIYNHEELRRSLEAKGHVYKTRCDTESIIHLYEEKGVECVKDLRGMFAFAIWDSNRRRLFLARDRIGIKPLYYTIKNGSLVFGSEIKAVLQYPGVERDVDPVALYHYLTFISTPAPMTLFKGIRKLEPGFLMTVDEGGNVKQEQYWDATIASDVPTGQPDGFYVERLRELLSESIRLRMMSDVPFGVFLSGGLDSSTNVALMARLMEGPVSTFTVGYKGYEEQSELGYARQIAREFNTSHHEIIIDHRDMLDALPKIIHHQDEPSGESVCVPNYYLAKLARDSGVPVIQMGEGSDEIFCGYEHYRNMLYLYNRWRRFDMLPGAIKKGAYSLTSPVLDLMGTRWKRYKEYVRRAAYGEELMWGGAGNFAFYEAEKGSLLTGDFRGSLGRMTSYNVIGSHYRKIEQERPDFDVLQRLTYLDLKVRLADLMLMRVDKMTMAHSVEARVPYLDHKLVEFAISLPSHLKLRGTQLKYILRQATQGVVPENIIQREKMGFWVPIKEWFMGECREYATATILDSGLKERGFFNTDFIESMMKDHTSGRADHMYQLWPLFNLALWHRYWIEGRDI
ncbi:MAG: asparagine synthase (glutamine-hydrolyzing) [Dehalococcoidia bacterium]|nr:asparagine synthase (glutamine-hydrolyzing) [Dehalococcoidia bacterium]